MTSNAYIEHLDIVGLYQQLNGLLREFRNPPYDTDAVTQTLAFSDSILGFSKSQPHLLFGQLQLYKSKLPYVINLSFNTAVITCLLCQRLHWNETSSKQLISAAVSLYAHQQANTEQYYQGKHDWERVKQGLQKKSTNLSKILAQYHYQCWQECLSLPPQIHRANGRPPLKQLTRLSPSQQLVYIAATLALLITPCAILPKYHFADAIQHLALGLPGALTSWLEPLLEFPGLYPPGCTLKHIDGRQGILLSVYRNHYLFAPLKTQIPEKLNADDIEKCFSPQAINSLGQIRKWWSPEWREMDENTPSEEKIRLTHSHYRLNRPPQSLLAIQRQLQTPEPDTMALTKLIDEEPLFASYIRSAAEQLSRLNLPSRDVRHALMMHGFERTSAVLIQQALLQRLGQHQFPLQQQLMQFTRLRGHIAAILARDYTQILPEQALCLATFACAGLFTQADLKVRTRLVAGSGAGFDIQNLFDISQADELQGHSENLAEAWDQEVILQRALRLHHKPIQIEKLKKVPAQLAYILGLSLIFARHWYLTNCPLSSEDEEYINQASHGLGISTESYAYLQEEVAASSHCFCPL